MQRFINVKKYGLVSKPQEQFKTIKRSALHLMETKGFMERYEEVYSTMDLNYEQAYEFTEQEYIDAFEKRRYRNAHNFRKSYNQYRSRLKMKK